MAEELDDSICGKPIQVRPSPEMRRRLEAEAEQQKRSLNNLVIVILERYFKTKAQREVR